MRMAIGLMDGTALRVIGGSNVIPDILLSYRKKRLCLHVRNYYMKIYRFECITRKSL